MIGSEVAHTKTHHLSLTTLKELTREYGVVNHHCNRYKTSTEQDLHVFPHIKTMHLDYYFSYAYILVVTDTTESEYVFKTFSREALKENDEGKKKNIVSAKWKELYSHILLYYHDFLDGQDELTVNNKLGAHSGKKKGLNDMGSSSLKTLPIIFRAGWEMRNAHTLFDYIVKQLKHDIDAAKVCAGWRMPYGDGIFGGYPCNIDDLKRERDKFEEFCNILFFQHGQK